MKQQTSYKDIFKSTALFGVVQVFNIVVKLGTNKVVAIFLGPNGMGIIGLYNSAISLLKTGAGLGISQSAVRDISEANNSSNRQQVNKIIHITNKVIVYTSLLGIAITIILSSYLSEWLFGNSQYVSAFIIISLVVGMNIYTDGQLAVLKGVRRLKQLANAIMIGSLAGFVSAVPLYYFFGAEGIVPSLLIIAFSNFFFSRYYVRQIKYKKLKFRIKELFLNATPMIKMGLALMFTNLLAGIVELAIAAYIRNDGGLSDVGFYNAGITILGGYFGIVITALATDYYPRISAINSNNQLLGKELNKQSIVSLIILSPLIVIFLSLLPFFVHIMYSVEFYPTIKFIRFGIFGTLITISSNQVDMILIAKFEIKLFTIIAVLFRITQLLISILLYNLFGLAGMGISLTIMGIIHMTVMSIAVYRLYAIRFNTLFVVNATIVFIITIISSFIYAIDNVVIRYITGIILITTSLFYSHYISKKYLNINLLEILKLKLKNNS